MSAWPEYKDASMRRIERLYGHALTRRGRCWHCGWHMMTYPEYCDGVRYALADGLLPLVLAPFEDHGPLADD